MRFPPPKARVLLTLCGLLQLGQGLAANKSDIRAGLHYLGHQLHAQLEQGQRLYQDAALQSYLTTVLRRVADPEGELSVHVLDDTQANAFIAPDGRIYVHLGLLLRIRDEAELALVLAHEAAHIQQDHPVVHFRNGPSATRQIAAKVPVLRKLFYAGRQVGFGQELEFAADERALGMLANAGYDSNAALRLYRRLAQDQEPRVATYAADRSGHPLIQERLSRFRAVIGKRVASSGEHRAVSYLAATQQARVAGLQRLLDLRHARTIVRLTEHDAGSYGPYAGYYLAAAQRILGQASERAVRAALNHTLVAAPDFAPAHRLLGQLQMDALDHAGAIAAFDAYLKLSPAAPDASIVKLQRGMLLNP